jgi:hypothetical protein
MATFLIVLWAGSAIWRVQSYEFRKEKGCTKGEMCRICKIAKQMIPIKWVAAQGSASVSHEVSSQCFLLEYHTSPLPIVSTIIVQLITWLG